MSEHEKPRTQRPLDGGIQAHLGARLREYYGSILAEPVPDRLTALLDRLEHAERAATTAPEAGEERR